MPKYTPEQLKEMAQEVATGDSDRAFQLILIIAMTTGLSTNEVVHRIQELADA